MPKKTLTTIAIIVLILVILPIGWYYWQNNSGNQGVDDLANLIEPDNGVAIYKEGLYFNTKFGYSVDYPDEWFIGYYGESKEQAQVVFFVSNQGDLQGADGEPPLGAKAEIIVHDLKKLKEMDASMSHIDTIDEYVKWQKTYQVGFDTEMHGKCIEENIKIGKADAIREICDNSAEDGFSKTRKVQLLSPDKNYIFLIQYLGREPYYSNNIEQFNKIYKSFNLNKN